MKNLENNYEIVIEPDRKWFSVDWKELIDYRDLLFLFVRRDFVAKYKQTVLGPAWFFLQPIVTSVVFAVVFKQIMKVPTGGIPSILFYLEGLVFWGLFSQCLIGSASCLTANARMFSKVYFPRLIIPLSTIASGLLTMMVQMVIFLGFYFFFKVFTPAGKDFHMTWHLLLVPVIGMQAAALGLGVGLWIAALTVKYRDLQYAVGFLIQLWMYATPVIYPASLVSEKWRLILILNPMAELIELSRAAFFGTPCAWGAYLPISAGMTALLFLSGVFMFNHVEKNFVDTL